MICKICPENPVPEPEPSVYHTPFATAIDAACIWPSRCERGDDFRIMDTDDDTTLHIGS
jgi:hypothetical protein